MKSLLPFILLSSTAFALNVPTDKPSADANLPQVVLRNFDTWDVNHDGVIDGKEIDSAIGGPSAVGPAAAALIALHRASHPRGLDVKAPKLDKTVFTSWDETSPAARSMTLSFTGAMKKVSARPDGLFMSNEDKLEAPTLTCMRQGAVGDCFFCAPSGAFTFRDPEAVKKMITELPDHKGYHVAFGDGEQVDVPPVTDAQYALGASTAGQGMWFPVLEQAYGKLKMEQLPADKQTTFYTDSITKGGMSKNVIALYTGHATVAIDLRSVKHTKLASTKPGDSATDDANTSKDLDIAERNRADLAMTSEQTTDKFRSLVKEAVAHHHLITAGGLARKEDMPPDMSANHVYAIVGYDADKDIVQVWNPHGQDFMPKGPDGLRNGYVTKHGRFDVPTKEFVQVFRAATFETDKPAPTPSNSPSPEPVTANN